MDSEIIILGGGIAGLSTAFAAERAGMRYQLYEAGSALGGNARTLRHGSFRYDTGAHRFHDRFPAQTELLRRLLGSDLIQVSSPSRIYRNGSYLDFPLRPLPVLRHLGLISTAQSAFQVLRGALSGSSKSPGNFAEHALSRYGQPVSEAFLLNYSHKLWGVRADRLSPAVAGGRLHGLSVRTALLELVRGSGVAARHLDGRFLYPANGIGQVAEALSGACRTERLLTRTPVRKILHNNNKVTAIQVAGCGCKRVSQLISTLPLSVLVGLLEPPPPHHIRRLASSLEWRNVVQVVVILDRDKISDYATTYFPDRNIPFTRIHEPRCRSSRLAPPGKTSLVAELPCAPGDALWTAEGDSLIHKVLETLTAIKWMGPTDFEAAAVHRMPHAYPVLSLDGIDALCVVNGWLLRLANLTTFGRTSEFKYVHIHDLMQGADELIARLLRRAVSA